MTIFAGCVTILKIAIVVKAVSVSRLRPPAAAMAAKIARVIAGEKMPSALARKS